MARAMLREIDSYIFVSLIICINQKKKKSVEVKELKGKQDEKWDG